MINTLFSIALLTRTPRSVIGSERSIMRCISAQPSRSCEHTSICHHAICIKLKNRGPTSSKKGGAPSAGESILKSIAPVAKGFWASHTLRAPSGGDSPACLSASRRNDVIICRCSRPRRFAASPATMISSSIPKAYAPRSDAIKSVAASCTVPCFVSSLQEVVLQSPKPSKILTSGRISRFFAKA